MNKEKSSPTCPHCSGSGELFNGTLSCPCTEGVKGEELEVMVALAKSLGRESDLSDGEKSRENREALFDFLSTSRLRSMTDSTTLDE